MDNFLIVLIGWLIVALVVSLFLGCLIRIGKHDLRETRAMKKIRKAGF